MRGSTLARKMESLTDDIFNNTVQTDDDADADADAHNVSSPERSSKKGKAKTGRWRSLSAFSASATMQDKLLEKSVPSHHQAQHHQIIPDKI